MMWSPPTFKNLFPILQPYGPFAKAIAPYSPHPGDTIVFTLSALLLTSSRCQSPTHSSRFNSKSLSYTKLCKIFPHPNLQLQLISWDSKPPQMSKVTYMGSRSHCLTSNPGSYTCWQNEIQKTILCASVSSSE